MSQISNIKLVDFESHKNTELDLGKVNILIGDNGAGKSSIVNAITLCLSGTLPTKPFSDYVRTSTKQAMTELSVKVGKNTRQTRKIIADNSKIKTELLSTNQLLQQMGTNPETARTLTDTWYFVESATEAARRNVLASVLSKEYTVEELQEAILAKSSQTNYEWHKTFISTNYLQLKHPKKTQMEVLYKIAFDLRANVKKEISSLDLQINDLNSKLSAYADIPQDVEAEAVKRTIDHTNISKDVEFAKQQNDNEKNALVDYNAKIDSLKNTKTKLEEQIQTKVTQKEVDELQQKIGVLESQSRGIKSQLDKINKNKDAELDCPVYGVKCGFDPSQAKAKLESDLTNIESNLSSSNDLYTDKKGQLDLSLKIDEIDNLLNGADIKVNEKTSAIENAEKNISEMESQLKTLEEAGILTQEGLDASKNQKEINVLQARKTVYEEDNASKKLLLSVLEEAVGLYKNKEIWTSLLSCNKDIFITKLKEIVELLIPKYTVAIDDEMNLSFDQVSINTLSKSEKFRVGVGIQTALSIAAKLGIVIIDGSDIVTDPTNLIETINKLGVIPEIETLIVTSSYDFTTKNGKRNNKIEVPATHYVITNGAIDRKPDLFGVSSW